MKIMFEMQFGQKLQRPAEISTTTRSGKNNGQNDQELLSVGLGNHGVKIFAFHWSSCLPFAAVLAALFVNALARSWSAAIKYEFVWRFLCFKKSDRCRGRDETERDRTVLAEPRLTANDKASQMGAGGFNWRGQQKSLCYCSVVF